MRICPSCGYERPIVEREIKHKEGDLEELTPEQLLKRLKVIPWDARRNFLAHRYVDAREKGYKSSWACFMFKDRFGRWPPRAMQHEAFEMVDQIIDDRRLAV